MGILSITHACNCLPCISLACIALHLPAIACIAFTYISLHFACACVACMCLLASLHYAHIVGGWGLRPTVKSFHTMPTCAKFSPPTHPPSNPPYRPIVFKEYINQYRVGGLACSMVWWWWGRHRSGLQCALGLALVPDGRGGRPGFPDMAVGPPASLPPLFSGMTPGVDHSCSDIRNQGARMNETKRCRFRHTLQTRPCRRQPPIQR